MSWDTSGSRYQYSHDETATVELYPSLLNDNNDIVSSFPSLISRVSLESTSTLQSSTPLFHPHRGVDDDNSHSDSTTTWDIIDGALSNNGTPFSKQVLQLLSDYPMQRLLIRVGDVASSSGGMIINNNNAGGGGNSNDDEQEQSLLQKEERARGPSGTTIMATFATRLHGHNYTNNNNREESIRLYYKDQYTSLLRTLLDQNLFPPCGAPLDSLRVRKHGHSIIVNTIVQTTVNVESYLAADAATFCNPGIQSLLLSNNSGEGGWAAATNNGACQSINDTTWGVFDSLFGSSSLGVKTLSELLLGGSGVGGGSSSNTRNSVWIDLQVSPACFASSLGDSDNANVRQSRKNEKCTVKATRGMSYRVAIPSSSQIDSRSDVQLHDHINVSIGDLLLGHHKTMGHVPLSLDDERMSWYPCPLSDSSKLILHLPFGFFATRSTNGFDDGDDMQLKERVEINVLESKDGYIDLAAPWAIIHRHPNNKHLTTVLSSTSSTFGISRTMYRPLGVSSSGTLVSVIRHGQSRTNLEEQQSRSVEVKSVDVIPGTLIKPRMHTLRMIFYQGGGAGEARFVPSIGVNYLSCDLRYNETYTCSNIVENCDSSCKMKLSLSDLQAHKLILNPDGTIHLDRTIILPPDSSIWMMVDYDEAYLPFQKFPADANRGVDIVPSMATFTLESTAKTMTKLPSITLFTTSLLILPPVPDMSMPFNVISLSCTLWAFVLGSLLNILVRRGTESVKRELTGEKEKRMIDKIRDKLKDKMNKLKTKFGRKVVMTPNVQVKAMEIVDKK